MVTQHILKVGDINDRLVAKKKLIARILFMTAQDILPLAVDFGYFIPYHKKMKDFPGLFKCLTDVDGLAKLFNPATAKKKRARQAQGKNDAELKNRTAKFTFSFANGDQVCHSNFILVCGAIALLASSVDFKFIKLENKRLEEYILAFTKNENGGLTDLKFAPRRPARQVRKKVEPVPFMEFFDEKWDMLRDNFKLEGVDKPVNITKLICYLHALGQSHQTKCLTRGRSRPMSQSNCGKPLRLPPFSVPNLFTASLPTPA